jgi:hypothetical protein
MQVAREPLMPRTAGFRRTHALSTIINGKPHTVVKIKSHNWLALILAGLCSLTSLRGLHAGETNTALEKSILEEKPGELFGGRVHGLVQLDISSAYITPRGLNVENQGVVFQPLILIFWNLYNRPDAFLNDVTLTTGLWNSIHTKQSGVDPGNWNEIDPIGGLTFKLGKGFAFDTFVTAFHSQTDSYPTSTNLSLKLSYHDSAFGGFSLNPFVEYWLELDKKATVVFDPATSSEGYYFALGLIPTYQFTTIPLKLELLLYTNIASNNFYQRFDGSDGGSGFALFSAQLKVSTPLSFIPQGYGAWTLYAGVKYYSLENAGLLDGNQVLADATREKDLFQFSGGISVFF